MAVLPNEKKVINGHLTQLGVSFRVAKKKPREAVFKCECGKRIIVAVGHVKTGHTKSCGCKKIERIGTLRKTHGLSQTTLFMRWHAMLRRCSDPNHEAFANYGGRGISVCERWQRFESFVEDMGFPEPGMTIERIDNAKGYSKENCKWAPRSVQNRNKRVNRILEHNGRSQCLADWEDELGLKRGVLRGRLNRGMPVERALTGSLFRNKRSVST